MGAGIFVDYSKVSGYEKKSIDVVLFMGICFLTVYAQIFSLFYKVGLAASVILLITDIFIKRLL